jgi:predicted DNA-binding transcriptional regulator AlpA
MGLQRLSVNCPRVMMRTELQDVLEIARSLSTNDLPAFLGDIEQIRLAAFTRLMAPAHQELPDSLLDVGEAARRLGVSVAYLYRNHETLPFTRRVGRSLRFSARGIEECIRRRSALTPRRQRV